jgi:hypothetical protein
VHNLGPVQVCEREDKGAANQLGGPKKLGLCEGSVYCQGVRSYCGPLLFGIRASSTVSVEPVEI